MKYTQIILFSIITLFFTTAVFAQAESEKLNLPGDNLNLYAVLKLFQESPTLESFEKSLNDSSRNINNLDLNADNKIDYIKVSDNADGDIHNISLKIPVSKVEEQDVAVFVVQKLANDKVQVQLIGDEDLYGKDYILEPNMENAVATGETPNPGYSANKLLANGETVVVEQTTTTQIAAWPVVQYIYVPSYQSWNSPWYWDYYPNYWQPWRPVYWHSYYGYHYNWGYQYYGHYRRWNHCRVPGWRDRYYGGNYRSRSPYVQRRYQQGGYRQTYARPQLAGEGVTRFRRDNPTAPAVNKLPRFDKSGTPVRVNPAVTTPSTRPVVKDRPGTKQPGTRPPVVRPDNDNTVKPQPTRPTKPVVRPETRPEVTPAPTRPTRPAVVRPDNNNTLQPVPDRPTRETRPNVRPAPSRPERPAFTPSNPAPRPSVRPAPVRTPSSQPARPNR